jgi:ferredoxin-NADP reductase
MTTVGATREVVVRERTCEAEDVVSLRLAAVDGSDLPAWEPGAHVDVHLPGGLLRQYSLCGDPTDRSQYRIAVLREPEGRGGSRAVHDEVRNGDKLVVSEPRNRFALQDAPRYLFIAGGIGITPILPMLRTAAATESSWSLLYGGRRRASMAFLPELVQYGDHVVVRPEDEFGRLGLEAALDTPQQPLLVYACGPPGLLDALERLCDDRPDVTLVVERFVAAAPEPRTGDDGGLDEADIVCTESGLTIRLRAECTVLAALREAGIEVPSSCEQGICGTCETRVVRGLVAHRDEVLDDAEHEAGESMMVCVSRPCTPELVLEV